MRIRTHTHNCESNFDPFRIATKTHILDFNS